MELIIWKISKIHKLLAWYVKKRERERGPKSIKSEIKKEKL